MFAAGDVIDGKYRVIRQLGVGGMGMVFEAEAMRLHRRVAIKVLQAPFAHREDLGVRFQLEAQAAGRIGSPHIVEVLDLGQLPAGEPYMVMELLLGETLRDRLRRQARLTGEQLLPIAQQLLSALMAAHAANVVHRDLKPDNVFLVRSNQGDFVKLLDFGVSKFGQANGAQELGLTQNGTLLGTPYYLSPEQVQGHAVDQRSDVYAAGVIFYEALTGRTPYQAEAMTDLLFKIVMTEAAPIAVVAPDVDPAWSRIVERAMARSREARFPSAAAMLETVQAAFAGGQLAPRLSAPARQALAPVPDQLTPEAWLQTDSPIARLAARIEPKKPGSPTTAAAAFIVIAALAVLTRMYWPRIALLISMYTAAPAPSSTVEVIVEESGPTPTPVASASANATAKKKRKHAPAAKPIATSAESAAASAQPPLPAASASVPALSARGGASGD